MERRGENVPATEHYAAAIKANPDYIAARLALARMYVRSDNRVGAIEQYREVVRREPENVQARKALAALGAESP